MKRNLRIIKKSLFYFKPFKWPMIITLAIIFVQKSSGHTSSYFLGKVVDSLSMSGVEAAVWFLVAYVVTSSVIPVLFNRIRAIYEVRTTDFDIYNYVQKTSLFKSLNLSLGQIRKEHSGFKQDVLRSGESSIDYFHQVITDEILPLISSFLVAIVGLYFIGFEFFVVSLIFTILFVGYGSHINSHIKEPLKELIKRRIERNKVYVDILRSLFFIKFANQKEAATKQLTKVQTDMRDHAEKIWVDFHKRSFVLDVMIVIYVGVIAYFVYQGLVRETLSVGMLIPVFSWVGIFTGSLFQVRNIQRRGEIALSDLEKMFEMLEQKTDLEECDSPLPIVSFEDKISFEGVAFDYADGKKGALKEVNFEIRKGDKVALVGRSGSGKTTIVSLILRLFDTTKGAILVDGVDLRLLALEQWHDLIAYVPQDGDLLDISIKENIIFGAKHKVSDAEIEDVLEKAGIKEFVHNLPHGIDTKVGERGVKLSGGQKQRVCIARALIKNAPILLLDEATSSLDSETEAFVNKAIWDMLGDKTGVVIAHRLSTILDADTILVMDHGEIVGIGSHEELLKTTPYYKTLVDAQNIDL